MPAKNLLDDLDFRGRVAAVTGGAQGIGRETAATLAALGADVALVDVAADTAAATADVIGTEHGVEAVAVEADVSDHDATDAAVERIVDDLGRLDVVVNNAGVWRKQAFVESEPADWRAEIDVCFVGTLNVTHSALPYLLDQESAAVVNVISDSYKGNDPGLAVYGAAKAASASFTRTLATEVGADGVRVNAVSPGMTRTPNTDETVEAHGDQIAENRYSLPRLGEPADIANAVAFLASDAAGWITGQVISVNGGYLRG
jgi:NAD(P)-dependent dehydrogenase (short-subunit alcohol dehydrogenase family)